MGSLLCVLDTLSDPNINSTKSCRSFVSLCGLEVGARGTSRIELPSLAINPTKFDWKSSDTHWACRRVSTCFTSIVTE